VGVLGERRSRSAVEHAVIPGEREREALHAPDGPVVVEHQVLTQSPDAENRRVRRVDDRRESVHAVHAERADRERPALEVGQFQRTGPGGLGEP